MLVTSLIAVATAAKWITAAKIMIAVGTSMTAIYPIVEKSKENQKRG